MSTELCPVWGGFVYAFLFCFFLCIYFFLFFLFVAQCVPGVTVGAVLACIYSPFIFISPQRFDVSV